MDEKQRGGKIHQLCKIEGADPDELVERSIFDSVAPGICINPDCDYTAEYEPDQREGWCECCDTGTVQSILVLMRMI